MDDVFRFAIAVSNLDDFEPKHFGDADRYLIYEYKNNVLMFDKILINKYKEESEEEKHGLKSKGINISKYLKENGINAIVSKQFGKNIRVVNNHFIPIIVRLNNLDDVLDILVKHMKWIRDEYHNNIKEYNLFIIANGIMKIKVKENNNN